MDAIEALFEVRGWSPFDFQRRVWEADAAGASGLLHAPTGMGKTLAVWIGPVARWLAASDRRVDGDVDRRAAEPLRVLWITPLRALASDTVDALAAPIRELGMPWTVEKRTGDTSQSLRRKQRERLPTALVTTPESLSLLLSYPDMHPQLRAVDTVIVDEWHELLASKRGTQTELCLARLRRWQPDLRTWGLSATLANLDEALAALVGTAPTRPAVLVQGRADKRIEIETLIPDELERFPWSGHLGLKMLDAVLDAIERAPSTLLFCNTRAQVEIWFNAITRARPDWLGTVALHHGSLDPALRAKVEAGLREGRARCVVCTSSLDLGVDFAPVEQVLQVGSPKGVARLMQRAGRSGHQPGATSRVLGVPTHAFELVEFAAARDAVAAGDIEARAPLVKPLDVLVQHLVTLALGGGFHDAEVLEEVRTTAAFRDLTSTELGWAVDFVTRGGPALGAYPNYQRVDTDEAGRRVVRNRRIASDHRLSIGTISADTAMQVRFVGGRGAALGTIEESFIAKLAPGDRFVFSGRVLELVRVRDLTAEVRLASGRRGIVPRWGGGRSPLSTRLAEQVRRTLEASRAGVDETPELRAVRPLLTLQQELSIIPAADEVLIERTATRSGHHVFLFPFDGRLVHEGIGAIVAHRIADRAPSTIDITVNDYGIELLCSTPLDVDEAGWRELLSVEGLLDDLLRCLNSNQLARRRFRDIARVAGLIHQGFPGARSKSARHLQASSELMFDVLAEFDPANLLLDQAKREVLESQLDLARLRRCLDRLACGRFVLKDVPQLTPLAFPIFAERLRTQSVSSEKWADRIRRMVVDLDPELEADGRPATHR